jgi:hypothetical protein
MSQTGWTDSQTGWIVKTGRECVGLGGKTGLAGSKSECMQTKISQFCSASHEKVVSQNGWTLRQKGWEVSG